MFYDVKFHIFEQNIIFCIDNCGLCIDILFLSYIIYVEKKQLNFYLLINITNI